MTVSSWFRAVFQQRLFAILAAIIIVGVAILSYSLRVSAGSEEAPAVGETVITLYDSGEERSFVTDKTTVQTALQDANVLVHSRDRVEPGLEEELVADEYTINIFRARPLLVIDGNSRQVIMTAAQSAEDVARDAGMTLYDEDIVEVQQNYDMFSGGSAERFVISRATPIRLTLFGETFTARTHAKTVGEFLQEKNIVLGKHNKSSAPDETPITAQMKLRIWREGKQTVTRDEKIDFEVEQIQDRNRPVGYSQIKTPGKKGEKSVTYEVTIRDGKEVKRREISSYVKSKPKKQVEVVGAKPSFSGDFADALAKLRSCEGGYDSINPAGPYYGAYQFDQGTWNSVTDAPYGNATPAQQDEAARKLYERRGWSPWPVCGQSLPDTYR